MRHNLIKARTSRELSQKELADILDLTQQAVSLLETGSRKPALIVAKKLEDFFNIPMEELFPDIFLDNHTTICNEKATGTEGK